MNDVTCCKQPKDVLPCPQSNDTPAYVTQDSARAAGRSV